MIVCNNDELRLQTSETILEDVKRSVQLHVQYKHKTDAVDSDRVNSQHRYILSCEDAFVLCWCVTSIFISL